MDIVRAFIGVHGFQVHHVANDVKLFGNVDQRWSGTLFFHDLSS